MNRDFFVDKVLRGEPVALVDVVKSNAESELEAIHREAESKRAVIDARLEAETRREAALTELSTVASELRAKDADARALRDEREAMIRAFDRRESALGTESRQLRLKLDFAFRFFNNDEPFDSRSSQTLKTIEFLRSQGIEIDANW
jgi:hypothetical protein